MNIENFVAIKNEIKKAKGDFTLFGLFLRDDAPNKWDLLIAAPWAEADKQGALRFIADLLTKRLDQAELFLLSRLVILEHDSPVLRAIYAAVSIKDSIGHFENCNLNGLQVKHAYILEAVRPAEQPVSG